MKFNPRRRTAIPRFYTVDRKLLIHCSEMPSPRPGRKPCPSGVDSEGDLTQVRSQDEVNEAFEKLASDSTTVRQTVRSRDRALGRPARDPSLEKPPRDPSLEKPPRDPSLEKPPRDPSLERPSRDPSLKRPSRDASLERLSRDSSLEKPPRDASLERAPSQSESCTDGDASHADHGSVTSSPLPPPSPKSLSRSPSLRRKGIWQPDQAQSASHTQPTGTDKPEDQPLHIGDPVWTPPSSPSSARKQYRPINYDSSSLERKKTTVSPQPSPPPRESFAWRAPDAPAGPAAVPARSSSLPRPESATVTLLREARQGHLPRGAQYLETDTHPDGRIQYNIPHLRPLPAKEVEGVGPTTREGMPVALRSTVKGENQQDWYRRVYDNLHRQPHGRSSYGLGGYSSEPELGYEDDIRPRYQSQGVEQYRVHPGRIEDYTPGSSSLAQQEAAKYWSEVMGYFDKFLDDHAHIKLERPLRGVRSAGNLPTSLLTDNFSRRALDGYESDSTLVYHRAELPTLTSGEHRSYYTQIQRGGEVPLTGLRKPAPQKPTVSSPRYQEAAVNIHYRSPVRWEERERLSDQELQRRQQDAMTRVYQEVRRKKQERQQEDLLSRRHGDNFTPSQKSPIPLDRYERLFDDVTDGGRSSVMATVLHDFRAQNNRELSLSRGDTVRIRRNIDANWCEGQKGTRIGIFPISYVQVNDRRERSSEPWTPRPQVRARHRFTAQTVLELSLNKGDVVSILRRVDDNWYEGRKGDATGIFPVSYVEPVSSDTQREPSVPRVKPVGAPAAHGLVMDGSSLKPAANQLQIDVRQEPLAYRTLFPYRHQNDDELDLDEGDVIHVLEQCPDGWYVGTNLRTGMFGTFPGNYTHKM